MYHTLILVMSLSFGHAAEITIYSGPNYTGSSLVIEIEEETCQELPHFWRNMVTSMRPQDSCLILYDQSKCSGRSERVDADERFSSDLTQLGFANKMVSFRGCNKAETNCVRAVVNFDLNDGWRLENYKKVLGRLGDYISFGCSEFMDVKSATGWVKSRGLGNIVDILCCEKPAEPSKVNSAIKSTVVSIQNLFGGLFSRSIP